METKAVAAGSNQPRNALSRSQVSASIELGSVHASLFEQILSLPLQSSQPPPEAEQPEPPAEPTLESNQETAESDDQPSEESSQEDRTESTTEVPVAIEVTAQLTESQVVQAPNNDSYQADDVAEGESPLGTASEVQNNAANESGVGEQVRDATPDQPLVEPVSESLRSLEQTSQQKQTDSKQAEIAPAGDEPTDAVLAPTLETDEPEETVNTDSAPSAGQTKNGVASKKEQRAKWFEREDQTLAQELDSTSHNFRSRVAATLTSETDTQASSESLLPDRAVPNVAPQLSSPSDLSSVEQPSIAGLNISPVPSDRQSASLAPATELDSGNRSTTARETTETPNSSSSAKANDRVASKGPAAADSAAKPDGLTPQERVRLVQRISRSFNRLSPTGGQINLRLHPPQLGSLSVQVKLEGRDMTAKLSTETAAAREVILENLPALRSRLAEQGFEVSQFQVDVAGGGADTLLDNRHGQTESGSQDSYRAQTSYRPQKATPVGVLAADNTSIQSPGWLSATSIDLHV